MKILLCASKTPDTTTKINFSSDKKAIESSSVQYILNPYDDHALARAMDIKEKHNGHLTIIHVGDSSSESILRKCLAVGADEAIRMDSHPHDAYFVAQQIAEVVAGKEFDLILTGRESIDFNGSQVCDLLGEMLNIPSIAFVTDIAINGNTFTLKRFIDGGEETVEVTAPVVLSATKELAEPRIPNMRGIMTARTKPIQVVPPTASSGLIELNVFEPVAAKSGCIFIDAEEAGKLIDILHEKEKVI
ncbi:MAG: electron transfer flavoprotein subunit beta/FixA family protein [Bacteroidota bacterium]|nr:electron transfer flavoprotein subunit beta/FixA family protein [Bacteroidota bacterium]